MVRTRTQTGTISRKDYGYHVLKLRGERCRRSPAPAPAAARSSPTPPQISPVQFEHDVGLYPNNPSSQAEDLSGGITGFPSVVFGEQETTGLSNIQRADREVQRWETIKAWHEENLPDVLPMVRIQELKAREARAAIEDNDENNAIGNRNRAEDEVQNRIRILEDGLESSKFDAEAENIRAAIAGYRSGNIPFSRQYTIIWAGQIVDTFDNYQAFTTNRTELLDRYENDYGYGWLWWESPLDIRGDERPQMQRCTELLRENTASGMGQYKVNQGFWKRFGWVARLPFTPEVFESVPDAHAAFFKNNPEGQLFCQQTGPRLVFESLLDSGATYPSLYRPDFERLGIDSIHYAAQSLIRLITSNGEITSRVFELFVSVVDSAGEELVDSVEAMYPNAPHYLGSLCPVSLTGDDEGPEVGPDGLEINNRLSGMVPFLACYMSSAPTMNILMLGEDRNDVLGAHRMPGQMRWDISISSDTPADYHNWGNYGNPVIAFSHKDGKIMDTDGPVKFTSQLSLNLNIGNAFRSASITRDPGQRLQSG